MNIIGLCWCRLVYASLEATLWLTVCNTDTPAAKPFATYHCVLLYQSLDPTVEQEMGEMQGRDKEGQKQKEMGVEREGKILNTYNLKEEKFISARGF